MSSLKKVFNITGKDNLVVGNISIDKGRLKIDIDDIQYLINDAEKLAINILKAAKSLKK